VAQKVGHMHISRRRANAGVSADVCQGKLSQGNMDILSTNVLGRRKIAIHIYIYTYIHI
jgi:hypothetical protein